MQFANEPTGNTNEASTIRKVIRKQKSQQLKSGRGYRVKETPDGTFLDLDEKKGGGGTSPPVYL